MPQRKFIAHPSHGVAWVTGASSGIGHALALDLANEGWRVVVTARSEKALQELSCKAQEMPGEIIALPGDVRNTQLMKEHCNAIEQEFGGVALLVANAGIYLPQDGLNADVEAFRTSFDVNLMGTVNVVLPAIDAMKERGRGQIAIVSSVAGYRGLPTSAAYGASKAALINFAESLKFDLDLAGIRIQLINPGFVDTPATRSNPFPMPHLITTGEAAREILDGMKHPTRFEIAFPKAFVRQLKALGLLPYRAYFSLVARTTGWNKKHRAG
ncbi:MAG: SDR family NAD(P)-dependent oxidoreductase [Rhodobacteraceae bacterium]|nr:SDR family NAD(P)-dependent oxidoreductase [Paracoccaceae bacterium]